MSQLVGVTNMGRTPQSAQSARGPSRNPLPPTPRLARAITPRVNLETTDNENTVKLAELRGRKTQARKEYEEYLSRLAFLEDQEQRTKCRATVSKRVADALSQKRSLSEARNQERKLMEQERSKEKEARLAAIESERRRKEELEFRKMQLRDSKRTEVEALRSEWTKTKGMFQAETVDCGRLAREAADAQRKQHQSNLAKQQTALASERERLYQQRRQERAANEDEIRQLRMAEQQVKATHVKQAST
eukprot:NODE_1091_length_1017_cov_104.869663_g1046_i0.p1 GENE.NODE_1091_length_1017_cov_104.869663_g1046_i0~~NODE_1091_length_1017_cov_104.869663_g1046_i0.p1  ORF type:complete len:247 (-),score=29.87 NODE_1091_length_1017_cov_104.869663_g1046_i0:208-948(-)